MVFYCKVCNKDIVIDEKETKGYWNWRCDCGSIASPKGAVMLKGLDTIKKVL